MRLSLHLDFDSSLSADRMFDAIQDILKKTSDYQNYNVTMDLGFAPGDVDVCVYWNDCADRARTLDALKELSNYILMHGL